MKSKTDYGYLAFPSTTQALSSPHSNISRLVLTDFLPGHNIENIVFLNTTALDLVEYSNCLVEMLMFSILLSVCMVD